MKPTAPALHAMIAIGLLTIAGAPLLAKARSAPAVAAGDAVVGGRLFLQCRACHVIGAGQADGVGPNLRGVVGAKAGSRPGFAYSPAMAKSGLTWNAATLDRFLQQPSAVVPGTRMAFAGVPVPKARANLIAYLDTLKTAKP